MTIELPDSIALTSMPPALWSLAAALRLNATNAKIMKSKLAVLRIGESNPVMYVGKNLCKTPEVYPITSYMRRPKPKIK